MANTWEACQRDSHDVKELVPELFYLPEMLRYALKCNADEQLSTEMLTITTSARARAARRSAM